MDLTPDQLAQLKSLGVALGQQSPEIISETISQPTTNVSKDIPKYGRIPISALSSTHPNQLLNIIKTPLFPLFSISGLTLISFGGLLLLKGKETASSTPAPAPIAQPENAQVAPTQVPKSIQHYLLASQQYFTQALSVQNDPAVQSTSELANLINQSILSATEAIKEFPQDYRGYLQRASVYQALADSKPEFLDRAIADYSAAVSTNPGSPELTRSLAALFAKKGDASNTLQYLARTVALEPTKAQNFYDLAKVQTQTGQIDGALQSYQRLLTIVSDPTQKSQVESEVSSLQKLASQGPVRADSNIRPSIEPTKITLPDSPSLIQADSGNGLIIAAPATAKDIKVSNLTDSNALAGSSTLATGQTQISITNQNLTPDSKIYLSIVSGGVNKSLQVLSRSGTTFQAGLDAPSTDNIVFKWWIVN